MRGLKFDVQPPPCKTSNAEPTSLSLGAAKSHVRFTTTPPPFPPGSHIMSEQELVFQYCHAVVCFCTGDCLANRLIPCSFHCAGLSGREQGSQAGPHRGQRCWRRRRSLPALHQPSVRGPAQPAGVLRPQHFPARCPGCAYRCPPRWASLPQTRKCDKEIN